MTPHQVIDGMVKLHNLAVDKEHFASNFDIEIWRSALKHLKEAVHFDFGDFRPEREHVDFGADLQDEGLLRLPYKSIFISGGRLKNAGLLVFEDRINEDVDKLTVITCGPGKDNTGIVVEAMPIIATWFEANRGENGEWHWSSAAKGGKFANSSGCDFGYEGIEDTSSRSVSAMYGALGFLATKEAEITRLPAPERLNKRRRLKGKTPVGERCIVTIKRSSLVRNGYAIEDRNSPRPHWRRGHLRRLKTGSVIPIPPCIVGAGEDLKAEVARKKYKVVG